VTPDSVPEPASVPAPAAVPDGGGHPDDELHAPTTDDPAWSETCWFTFTVPDRRLSGQFYPYFLANLGVVAAGAYFWDPSGDTPASCRYAKNFWHLPFPTTPLTDLRLANGLRYHCVRPQQEWELGYDDPDGDEIHVELTFTAVAPPNRLFESHLDQPGRVRGTIVLHGETIEVDAFGFRDRSWGPRTQFGPDLQASGAERGGYSYATASEHDGFHTITMDWGTGCVNLHGYLLRDGTWSKLATATRLVTERDTDGYPVTVSIDGTDELGRSLHAVGRTHNRFAFFINPNLFSRNCLTEWTFDGVTAWGEDHDNWSATAIRRSHRPG
jgi:hypothetical protein